MPTVNMKCLYCNDYRIRCKGKGKACDKFPGQPDRPEKKEAGAGE